MIQNVYYKILSWKLCANQNLTGNYILIIILLPMNFRQCFSNLLVCLVELHGVGKVGVFKMFQIYGHSLILYKIWQGIVS